ncbi:MAG: 3-dehydroquinate synthase [Bacillota bacterium]
MQELHTVKVALSHSSYEITIGIDSLTKLGEQVSALSAGRQAVLVSDEVVYKLYGQQVKESLVKAGFDVLVYTIPPGEEQKTWDNGEKLLTSMLTAGFNRDAIVAALGGGVVGDLAGFAASIYQRGICLVQIPTTLLAQVDSSVGGKVAVNHPLGKNMIGSFYQPKLVWADLTTLKSLPEREWRAGLAEVIKYGVIWDQHFFNFLEANAELLQKRETTIMEKIVNRSCQIKAEIVVKDEKEEGIRAILNFGHTIGHVLELVTKYKVYRHGEAVAIGMVAAAKLGANLGLCNETIEKRLRDLLGILGLPVDLPRIEPQLFLESMALDKKVKEKKLVFILPRDMGNVEIIKGIEPQKVLTLLGIK